MENKKQFLVHIAEEYKKAIKNLQGIKYNHIDECIRHRHSEKFTMLVDEQNLKLVQEKYEVKIEGEINEIAQKLHSMLGKGNRFSENVLNAKII